MKQALAEEARKALQLGGDYPAAARGPADMPDLLTSLIVRKATPVFLQQVLEGRIAQRWGNSG